MTPEDWQAIEAAFREAAALPAAERDAFVERFAARHPALAERLRGMLAADAGGDSLLADPIGESVRDLADGDGDPWIGREVGAWKITRRIAVGGMGAVFVAERADRQFEQTVALKVMSAQLLAPDAVARFRAERQILATLNHPYIAQLHDGGTTDDGLPFLVMEYVEGLPIDAYCERHDLGIAARLELFRKVCAAVDYAHRNLTVHRDLKPSNILIDADGNPKLLDFGIAKLLEPGAANLTQALTRQGARAMTPEYASPEQVRGESVSVATDVYSLGVLLYRLLTGVSPYGGELSSHLDYERAILEEEPRRPSTSLTLTGSAGRDDVSTKRLRSVLAGDLDNIVLMALQKEPERRYPAVSDLSADLGRHLRHEPIVARGDDWSYIASKYLRRNARALTIASVVVAGIAGLVSYYTLQLANERDRASLSAQQASEVSGFLAEIFESASPLQAQGDTPDAIDLLERGAERIETLSDQPSVQAELYRIIGWSFKNLGKLERAEELLQRSLELRSADPAVDPPALSLTVENLAETHKQQLNHDGSIAGWTRALELRREAHGDQHPEVARVLGELGAAYGVANLNERALEFLNEALAMKRRLGAEPDWVTADILGGIGVALDDLGRFVEAAEAHREAIALSEVVNGPLHPYTIIRMSNLALVLRRQFRLQESDDAFTETIRRARQTWPADHPRLGFYLQSHGLALTSLGRFDEALPRLEEAVEIALAHAGERSFNHVGALYGLSNWYTDRGRYDDAMQRLESARRIAVELGGEDHYMTGLVDSAMAKTFLDAGRWTEAETTLRRLLANEENMHAYTLRRARAWLALACAKQDRWSEGEPLLRQALAEMAGNSEASLVTLLTIATETLRAAGQLDESLVHGAHVHRIVREQLPADNWLAARATEQYARSLHAAGQVDEARSLLRSVQADYRRVFGAADYRAAALSALL